MVNKAPSPQTDPVPFFKKPETKKETSAKKTPSEVVESFLNDQPEKTKDHALNYSLNTYLWTFQRFMENWAIDMRKWWQAPLDYISGRVPEGGDLWVKVIINKSGELIGYKILTSNVSHEMELRVIQALIGSLKQPNLPPDFPKDYLIIYWRFIYPSLQEKINLRKYST